VPPTILLGLADPRALGMMTGDGLWVRLVDLLLAAPLYGHEPAGDGRAEWRR
jgi:hypothetical protein